MKTKTEMTVKGVEALNKAGFLERVCTSWYKGYVSRKGDGVALQYQGRYGKGFAVLTPSFKSTQYCYITYFVK